MNVPTREWFINVDSVCSLVGHRRYGLTDDELAEQLKAISLDARRFADTVGDRYVGGFPITLEAMAAHAKAHGQTNASRCNQGFHAWMPWLQINSRTWVTYCVNCDRQEQWDA